MTSSPGSQVARSARSTASEAPTVIEDLLGRVVADAVQPLEVIRQGPPQLDGPVVGGVVRAALAQALDAGLDDLARACRSRAPRPRG